MNRSRETIRKYAKKFRKDIRLFFQRMTFRRRRHGQTVEGGGATAKIIILRPQGGLNDMLCRIELCAAYAERNNRILYVDTHYHGSRNLRVTFSDFFVSTDPRLRLDLSTLDPIDRRSSIHPLARVDDLERYVLVPNGRRFVSSIDHRPIIFDLGKAYPHDILVYSAGGGGVMSIEAMRRLRLHERLVELLRARLDAIGSAYDAIHIRHTDHQSHYRPWLDVLSRKQDRPLFVATDNRAVLDDFRKRLGERVQSFARLPDADGRPIHLTTPQDMATTAMDDAILDLMTLSFARNLHLVRTMTTLNDTVSGYSRLARELHRRPAIRDALVGRTPVTMD